MIKLKISKEERTMLNNEVIINLDKLNINYRLIDPHTSQFHIYINNSLIVYYASKNACFYDIKYENKGIQDLIEFIKEKKTIDNKSLVNMNKDLKIEELEKEIKINNLLLKVKDKKLNEYKNSIPKDKIIELLNKNSKFNFIAKKDIEELLNE